MHNIFYLEHSFNNELLFYNQFSLDPLSPTFMWIYSNDLVYWMHPNRAGFSNPFLVCLISWSALAVFARRPEPHSALTGGNILWDENYNQ